MTAPVELLHCGVENSDAFPVSIQSFATPSSSLRSRDEFDDLTTSRGADMRQDVQRKVENSMRLDEPRVGGFRVTFGLPGSGPPAPPFLKERNDLLVCARELNRGARVTLPARIGDRRCTLGLKHASGPGELAGRDTRPPSPPLLIVFDPPLAEPVTASLSIFPGFASSGLGILEGYEPSLTRILTTTIVPNATGQVPRFLVPALPAGRKAQP